MDLGAYRFKCSLHIDTDETSWAELLHDIICFHVFYKAKFGIFVNCFPLATVGQLGVKGLFTKL